MTQMLQNRSKGLLLVLFLCIGNKVQSGNMESRVINYLFNGTYNKEARPSLTETESVIVEFQIVYAQLVDMEEKLQTLKSNIWVRQKWRDYQLFWNPDDFGGVKSVNVNPDLIWKPDIVLYNSVDDKGEMYKFTTKASISCNGTITWLAPAVVTTSCPINILLFPFDTQVCVLTFGSWTYDGNKLNLTFLGEASADLSAYSPSGEWELLSVNAVKNEIYYTCCSALYYSLTYNISLRRLTLFYSFYLIIPCIVLATVVAISFLFPQESGQRLSLVITVMLGMTVFMLIITNNIPPTSMVVPLIGKFFTALLIEIAVALIMTGMTLELYYASPKKEMPHWIKILIFRVLGSVFSLKKYKKRYDFKNEDMQFCNMHVVESHKEGFEMNGKVQNGNGVIHSEEAISAEAQNGRNIRKASNNISNTEVCNNAPTMRTEMQTINKGIKMLCQVNETLTEDLHRKEEWQAAAKILDRFFFTLVMSTVILTVVICFYGI